MHLPTESQDPFLYQIFAGGPNDDWGIKNNRRNGEPAPEKLTDIIYAETKSISSYITKKVEACACVRSGVRTKSLMALAL